MMSRRVFFSFKYEDVTRAMVVRNSWKLQESAGFVDAAEFEKLKQQGDAAIKSWIDDQLIGTSVTVVLVGTNTSQSRWVKYEIEASIARGNGLIGIDISKIKDFNGNESATGTRIPTGYSFYKWHADDGYHNLGTWVESAAVEAGK
jgi:hypothetical protein